MNLGSTILHGKLMMWRRTTTNQLWILQCLLHHLNDISLNLNKLYIYSIVEFTLNDDISSCKTITYKQLLPTSSSSAAAGGSLGVTQKAMTFGLGQTGHPEVTTDYHRGPRRRSSHVEQFVVIDAQCIFVACVYVAAQNANFSVAVTASSCARCWSSWCTV